jgi:hypothetical protein
MLVYLLGYLDRSNLGNARIMGLPNDILNGDPTGVQYALVNTSFYLCVPPSCLIRPKPFPP